MTKKQLDRIEELRVKSPRTVEEEALFMALLELDEKEKVFEAQISSNRKSAGAISLSRIALEEAKRILAAAEEVAEEAGKRQVVMDEAMNVAEKKLAEKKMPEKKTGEKETERELREEITESRK